MREIKLTQGCVALVDDGAFAELSQYNWHASKSGATFYATRHAHPTGAGLGKAKMHHMVIGHPSDGMVVDHIDGNGLNNQLANLRFVTVRQNQQNQVLTTCKKHSKYPGVSRYVRGKYSYWVAGAKFNGKRKTIGYFDTEEAAHAAYLQAIKSHEESQNA